MIPVPPGPELPPERGWSQTIGPVPAQQGEIFGRILDPVRAHALTEAVAHVGVNGVEGEDVPGEVLAIAERFEAWLGREERG
jgi:hypothetical protein